MLILSLLALFAGPLLYHWMQQGGLIAKTLDRLVAALLVVVVIVLLLPQALHALGLFALALILAGYLVPGLLETGIRGASETFHLLNLCLASLGLVLHAMLDGVGLAGGADGAHRSLALAIVLHRMGMGLVLWLMLEPAFGRVTAAATLALVCVATLIGYGLSDRLLPFAGGDAVMFVQSLIIGMIIHSLLHRGHVRHRH